MPAARAPWAAPAMISSTFLNILNLTFYVYLCIITVICCALFRCQFIPFKTRSHREINYDSVKHNLFSKMTIDISMRFPKRKRSTYSDFLIRCSTMALLTVIWLVKYISMSLWTYNAYNVLINLSDFNNKTASLNSKKRQILFFFSNIPKQKINCQVQRNMQ